MHESEQRKSPRAPKLSPALGENFQPGNAKKYVFHFVPEVSLDEEAD